MKGLIAATGRCTRLQDLSENGNKVPLNLGGDSLSGNIVNHFTRVSPRQTLVVAGCDAAPVQTSCRRRATSILSPFCEPYGSPHH